MTCTHEIWERETDAADGGCSICLRARIEVLEKVVVKVAEAVRTNISAMPHDRGCRCDLCTALDALKEG